MKISYLGPSGTFTEYAAKKIFPNDELIPYKTIPNCIDAVRENEVEYSVVPIENAIEGSVTVTVDYLFNGNGNRLPIVADITIPIKQHLMVHPYHEKTWELAKSIYSHPQAIAQAHHYLREKFPNASIHYTDSTASAAKFVRENPDEMIAAIGNQFAAETYGLQIVQHDIHDFQNNHTKFVVLSRKSEKLPKGNFYTGDRTTIKVTLPSDYPGALHQVLSAFAWRKLNLSKIESRPLKTGLGNYFFIIDVEMEADEVLIPGVKAELEALGCGVDIIGSYPCFKVE
ncbi:prephenate dehydratase [Pueribacillus theae]|uniref:Prephenate dehydratase n=1 Tax=Pueribacillus theae TaxID=2171751 RepID=A0A2U1JZW7_9BACI|nr:prephenate dehydratase [Pueribacillus theae]PWA10761.1 prephenate dehydratase [Pueribacillus theae]